VLKRLKRSAKEVFVPANANGTGLLLLKKPLAIFFMLLWSPGLIFHMPFQLLLNTANDPPLLIGRLSSISFDTSRALGVMGFSTQSALNLPYLATAIQILLPILMIKNPALVMFFFLQVVRWPDKLNVSYSTNPVL
jgi:hypothetical protein